MGQAWKPVIDGDLGDAALGAAHAIADALCEQDGPQDPSLGRGQAGIALFFSYLAQGTARARAAETATRHLERALELAAAEESGSSLYGGVAGVAWTVQHLCRHLLDEDCEPVVVPIDQALCERLRRSPWQEPYDLITGLVGYGVYLLERLPHPLAFSGLERIVDHLDALSERTKEGVTWHTPAERLPDWQREQAPKGYYNTGVAHGVPGVVALLGELCAAGVANHKTKALLEGALAWLLAQELPESLPSAFPYWTGPMIPPEPSRLAWCYGDLGVAVTLLVAARSVGRLDWENEGLRIARRTTDLHPESTGVVDAGLCHGASGLGHLYNRLYHATGEEVFASAARFWFRRTLELRRPDAGIAGFYIPAARRSAEGDAVADPGFLTGVSGIGLALLSAAKPVEPLWDRLLLASLGPSWPGGEAGCG